ncbi:hypothetical protein BV22DRAFT_1037914 [Leucogyrophana mollusca]|uniref:Uncharacterized protein n=1 Tax=Leucogyrophana mollusca TaxID=85980 RepID=A0ACB8BB86_9AGAM|nr:hypothetical protein BV22DRAFT_1037914 [Leucogyrophana mollusca]
MLDKELQDLFDQVLRAHREAEGKETDNHKVVVPFTVSWIGRPLSTGEFGSSKNLVQAMLDAITAHKELLERCDKLHGDVSPQNIMVSEDGRGFLVDWDLAK